MKKTTTKTVATRVNPNRVAALLEQNDGEIPGLKVGGKSDNFVWDVNDRFGHARATRVLDMHGNVTKFALVHGKDSKGEWQPVRVVSDRYVPLPTSAIVDRAMDALNGDLDKKREPIHRHDRSGTMHGIMVPTNRKIEIGRGKPFDAGHPWASSLIGREGNHGINRDVVIPTINIRNAYDATSAVIFDVGLYRLICENGAKIMMAGFSIKAIHTLHEISNVVESARENQFKHFDDSFLKRLPSIKVEAGVRKSITEALPEKWHKDFTEYAALGNNSAWAILNGLSYLQTHEYTLSRGRQLDKLVGQVFAAANN